MHDHDTNELKFSALLYTLAITTPVVTTEPAKNTSPTTSAAMFQFRAVLDLRIASDLSPRFQAESTWKGKQQEVRGVARVCFFY